MFKFYYSSFLSLVSIDILKHYGHKQVRVGGKKQFHPAVSSREIWVGTQVSNLEA